MERNEAWNEPKEQKEREKNKSVLSFHSITSLFFSFLFLSFSPNSTDKEWMACLFCVDFNLITNEVEQVRELNERKEQHAHSWNQKYIITTRMREGMSGMNKRKEQPN